MHVIGDPGAMETAVGPVINAQARDGIDAHITKAKKDGRLLHQVSQESLPDTGFFVAHAMISIDRIADLEKEIFGPVLHVIRFEAEDMLSLCDEINATGYALTFGIHSLINHRIDAISRCILAGNVYINRNMVGTMVGSQPLGGSGLSGTGPKAGDRNTWRASGGSRASAITWPLSAGTQLRFRSVNKPDQSMESGAKPMPFQPSEGRVRVSICTRLVPFLACRPVSTTTSPALRSLWFQPRRTRMLRG